MGLSTLGQDLMGAQIGGIHHILVKRETRTQDIKCAYRQSEARMRG